MASRPGSIFLIIVQSMTLIITNCNAIGWREFPAILVFGDSTVDTGNNNFIPSIARGNHLPYGKDFPGHIPTGRFSNGKLVPDFIASALGIKELVPPFLDPHLSKNELRTGVSFASGGSGYDDVTLAAGGVIPMSKQIEHFKGYITKLNAIVGEEERRKVIKRALVIISAGTNDFMFNIYDLKTRRLEFNATGYQDFLLKKLKGYIKELYDLGCRTIVVAGLPPIGCLPVQITAKFNSIFERKCVEDQNQVAQAYNHKLATMLPQLQADCPWTKFIYVDVYTPLIDMIMHPHKYGFVETNKGCCGSGLYEAGPLCCAFTPLCQKHNQFLFWDSVHPSESAYQFIAHYIEREVFPILLDSDIIDLKFNRGLSNLRAISKSRNLIASGHQSNDNVLTFK